MIKLLDPGGYRPKFGHKAYTSGDSTLCVGLAHTKTCVWYQDPLPPHCIVIITFSNEQFLIFLPIFQSFCYASTSKNCYLCNFLYFHIIEFSVIHIMPLIKLGRNRILSLEVEFTLEPWFRDSACKSPFPKCPIHLIFLHELYVLMARHPCHPPHSNSIS